MNAKIREGSSGGSANRLNTGGDKSRTKESGHTLWRSLLRVAHGAGHGFILLWMLLTRPHSFLALEMEPRRWPERVRLVVQIYALSAVLPFLSLLLASTALAVRGTPFDSTVGFKHLVATLLNYACFTVVTTGVVLCTRGFSIGLARGLAFGVVLNLLASTFIVLVLTITGSKVSGWQVDLLMATMFGCSLSIAGGVPPAYRPPAARPLTFALAFGTVGAVVTYLALTSQSQNSDTIYINLAAGCVVGVACGLAASASKALKKGMAVNFGLLILFCILLRDANAINTNVPAPFGDTSDSSPSQLAVAILWWGVLLSVVTTKASRVASGVGAALLLFGGGWVELGSVLGVHLGWPGGLSGLLFLAICFRILPYLWEVVTSWWALLRALRRPERAVHLLRRSPAFRAEATLWPQPFLAPLIVEAGKQDPEAALEAIEHTASHTFHLQSALDAFDTLAQFEMLRCLSAADIAALPHQARFGSPDVVSSSRFQEAWPSHSKSRMHALCQEIARDVARAQGGGARRTPTSTAVPNRVYERLQELQSIASTLERKHSGAYARIAQRWSQVLRNEATQAPGEVACLNEQAPSSSQAVVVTSPHLVAKTRPSIFLQGVRLAVVAMALCGLRLIRIRFGEELRLPAARAAANRKPELLVGHSNRINCLVFSPDGRMLASGGADESARLWDIGSGQVKATLAGVDSVGSAVWTKDGRKVITEGDGVQIWDAATGRLDAELQQESEINSLALSADERTVLGWSAKDGQVWLWNRERGTLKTTLSTKLPLDERPQSFAASRDLKYLALTSRVVAQDKRSPKSIGTGTEYRGRIWNLEDGRVTELEAGEKAGVQNAQPVFSPDGRLLATAGMTWQDGVYSAMYLPLQVVHIWDAETGRLKKTLEIKHGEVGELAFSPDGLTLVATNGYVGGDGSEKAWQWSTATFKRELVIRDFSNQVGRQSSPVFSPDGELLATHSTSAVTHSYVGEDQGFKPEGVEDASVRIWNTRTGKLTKTIRDRHIGEDAVAMAFSPAKPGLLAIGNTQGDIQLWDIQTGKQRTLPRNATAIQEMHTAEGNGHTLAARDADGTVRLWNLQTGQPQAVIRGLSADWLQDKVAVSPDGRLLAACRGDSTVGIWNTSTGKLKRVLRGAGDTVLFSPNSKVLVTANLDGEAPRPITITIQTSTIGRRLYGRATATRLWDVETGLSKTLKVPGEAVRPFFFSRNGHTLITRSAERDNRTPSTKIWFWNTQSGRMTAAFSMPNSGWDPDLKLWRESPSVLQTMLSEDEKTMAVVTRETLGLSPAEHLWLWDVPRQNLIAKISLPDYRKIGSVAVSNDGGTVAVSDGARVLLYDVQNKGWKGQLEGHGAEVSDVIFSLDEGLIITFSDRVRFWNAVTGRQLLWVTDDDLQHFAPSEYRNDPKVGLKAEAKSGIIELRDLHNERLRARLIPVDTGNGTSGWVAMTPEGYYDGSTEAVSRIIIRDDSGQPKSLGQFERRFFRPDLVRRALRGERIEAPTGVGTPPEAEFTLKTQLQTTVTGDSVEVEVVGWGQRDVVECQLLVNNRPVSQDEPRSVRAADASIQRASSSTLPNGSKIFRTRVPLRTDEPLFFIEAVVFDDQGNTSKPCHLSISRPGTQATRGNLYVVAVGVSRYSNPEYNLRFAAADAEAVSEMFKRQEGVFYKRVFATPLVDQDASSANVRQALSHLAEKARDEDTVIVYLAGHGEEDEATGEFYFGTFDMNRENLAGSALSEKDLRERLGPSLRTGARRFLLADVCLAGQISLGSHSSTSRGISSSVGVVGLGSSAADQSSYEDVRAKHGYFTAALLSAIEGGQAADKDGYVRWVKLKETIGRLVRERNPNPQDVTELAGDSMKVSAEVALIRRK